MSHIKNSITDAMQMSLVNVYLTLDMQDHEGSLIYIIIYYYKI